MFDVVIRGGDVVDGTGAPRRRADVGVQGDRVVEIGTIEGDAATVIDATGKVVGPGFIDVHTHFDAQVFWDGARRRRCTASPPRSPQLRLHHRAAVGSRR
jgi:N-acyl-D-aspartate/D-glutamate deacylase